MTKVCKDYGLVIRTIGTSAKPGAGNYTKEMFYAAAKKEYPPEEGWEQVDVFFTGQSPEGYTIGIIFNKYEYIADGEPVTRTKSK